MHDFRETQMSHMKNQVQNHATRDAKKELKIVPGDNFQELRISHGYYVDKTAQLEKFLDTPSGSFLFTRPRRFGKTLFLSMVANFLDVSKKSRELFKGLAIGRNKELCDKWMNKCPVIELTLGSADSPKAPRAISQIRKAIRHCYREHSYLLRSEKLEKTDKIYYNSIFNSQDPYVFDDSLLMLSMMLEVHHGRKPVILLDEYDIPLRNAYDSNDISNFIDVRDFISPIYRSGLKDNKYMQFAIIAGCTHMSKEDHLSGLNNLKCYGIDSFAYSDMFGLTDSEVDDLLRMANLSKHKKEIQEWYDGYRIGNDTHIYCPWDVLSRVDDLLKNPDAKPQSYWVNTSNSQTERDFLAEVQGPEVDNGIAALVSGHHIVTPIEYNLSHYNLYENSNNIWSLLYFLGYLTKASKEYIKNHGIYICNDKFALVIPNKSIHTAFMKRLYGWMESSAKKCDTNGLVNAIKNFNVDEVEKRLNNILLETVSAFDYNEFVYHGLLCGLLKGSFGDNIFSNRETGHGRADIVAIDGDVAHIIEVKRGASSTGDALPALAQKALDQIDDRNYALSFKKFSHVACWGMAFASRSCKVVLKQLR